MVGNLAHNFRMAWEENETGKRILEGVRDVIGVIVQNIRNAADATVEWSKNLDFSPLLTKVQEWIASLVPVFDSLSGILADFYTQVLLPLGQWVLEKGLPDLLQVFIDFNNKVDWEALRARLAEFWKHLEPFAETVGEGLILFIRRLSDVLANFINSPTFDNFLTRIEDWMDSVKPEDVADALGKLAAAIIGIKVAVMTFSAVSSVIPIFKNLAAVLGLFGPAGIAIGALALAGFLSETIKNVDMAKVGQVVSDALKTLINFIGTVLGETDWYALGQKVIEFIAGIDWAGLFETLIENLAKILGNVIGGSVALVAALAEGLGQLIINSLAESGRYWREKVEECGGNIIAGLLKGIKDRIVGIGKWIYEHIFQPFIDGIKSAFGIASPSKVMEEMGTYIMEGLLNGITGLVDSVTQIWENMKEIASKKWEEVKQNLSDTWENIKQNANTVWTGIKDFFSSTCDNIKEASGNKWKEISDKISNKLKDIKDDVKDIMGRIKEKWSDSWDDVKDKVSTAMDDAKSAVKTAAEWIGDKLKGITDKIKDVGKKATSSLTKSSTRSSSSSRNTSSRSYSLNYGTTLSSPVPQALASLANVEIPAYATGQVIPRTMKQHLAILGDNTQETEVVSPISTIEEALENTAVRLGLTGGNGNTYHFEAKLNGRTLFEETIRQAKMQQMATGVNPFML